MVALKLVKARLSPVSDLALQALGMLALVCFGPGPFLIAGAAWQKIPPGALSGKRRLVVSGRA